MSKKVSPSSFVFNKECPVCLTEDKNMWKLDCKHCAHLECLKGMNKLECPLCRSKITNLPAEIKENIEKNHIDYRIEQNADYDRLFGRMMEEEGTNQFSRITIESEIRMALQYLVSLGISQMRLPAINMEIYDSGPLPRQGEIFQTIVTTSINRIQQELDQDVEEEGEGRDSEEEIDSEEDIDSEEETISLRSLRPFTFYQFLGALAGASLLSSTRR